MDSKSGGVTTIAAGLPAFPIAAQTLAVLQSTAAPITALRATNRGGSSCSINHGDKSATAARLPPAPPAAAAAVAAAGNAAQSTAGGAARRWWQLSSSSSSKSTLPLKRAKDSSDSLATAAHAAAGSSQANTQQQQQQQGLVKVGMTTITRRPSRGLSSPSTAAAGVAAAGLSHLPPAVTATVVLKPLSLSRCKAVENSSSCRTYDPSIAADTAGSSRSCASLASTCAGCTGSPRAAAGLDNMPRSRGKVLDSAGTAAGTAGLTFATAGRGTPAGPGAVSDSASRLAAAPSAAYRVASQTTSIQHIAADSASELHQHGAHSSSGTTAARCSSMHMATPTCAVLQQQQRRQQQQQRPQPERGSGGTAETVSVCTNIINRTGTAAAAGAAAVQPSRGITTQACSNNSSRGIGSRACGWLSAIATYHPLAWHVAAVQLQVSVLMKRT
jgi:hypothetical protein